MADSNLVTSCSFHDQEYLFKMKVFRGNLEILVTDKNSGEEWQCNYDATYIENLTHKTGNFKQFDIFVAMIKAGLLKTSESVTLDLLTFEDLEMLRTRKITKTIGQANTNKRYLIVTYVVEFDKIRYPLPLEYCGMPDPIILQTTIRRLELELAKTREELVQKQSNSESKRVYFLQQKVEDLQDENCQLKEEIRHLTNLVGKKQKTNVLTLQRVVDNLEKSVFKERNSHHELVQKLKYDNAKLLSQLENVKCSEKSLKLKLNQVLCQTNTRAANDIGDHLFGLPEENDVSCHSLRTMYRSPLRNRTSSPSTVMTNHYIDDIKGNIDKNYKKLRKPRSRSKRNSASMNNLDIEDKNRQKTANRSVSPSPVRNRLPSPTNTKCITSSRSSSRASSQGSKASRTSKGSARKSERKKTVDYKILEEKIEDLQRLLRSNYLSKKSSKKSYRS